MTKSIDSPAKEGVIFYVCFAYILLDSFTSYVLTNFFGFSFPTNALLPVLFLIGVFRNFRLSSIPPPSYLLFLALLFISLIIGGFIATGELMPPLMKNASLVVSFLVGYACFRNCENEGRLFLIYAIVSMLYTTVCAMAVVEVAPSIFPVTGKLAMLGGDLVFRYEITTDQNFQVLYLFGSTTLLLAARRLSFVVVLLVFTGLNFYVLSEIQTRSGFGVLLLTLLIVAFVRIRRLTSSSKVLFPIAGIALLIISALVAGPILGEIFEKIVLRFTESDFDTVDARTEAMVVFFKLLFDPLRWLPLDANSFINTYGYLPHFSPAVIMLQGGIFAVVSWMYLQCMPIAAILWLLLVRRPQSRLLELVATTAFGSFIVYLSAPIHAWDVVWMWTGAAVGCLVREQSARTST